MTGSLYQAAVWSALFAFAPMASASERLEDGKRTYEKICAGCHQTGVEGAPVVGKADDWDQRSSLWDAVLVEHAQNGYLKMPAHGNADYTTDYDVGAAAEYMLTLTHPELPAD
ncbi:c-type cytochrome [Pseudohalioglobus lutimaris]|uniref:Cytochrome c5 family protein n=1 Tax=Pseudohalioglobus lutimaris TaxID=1737061 RepID=A0A2N5X429_9GAMM|nr:c-type cytochrome [Pseudohalioglobus lutimaris]PLW69237.1 cytochrome c5 family protein [Pseudohalioglobus lutimaris]